MEQPESAPRGPSPAQLSKTPSWVMLGFLLGALFVWSLPRPAPPPAVAPPPVKVPEPAPVPPRLTAIEAVFGEWSGPALWENDTTEVGLWNPERNAFTDFFEVMRSGGNFYFRSIPRLTRPLLTRGVPENSPLEFTEPPAHRQEWLRQVGEENWRSFAKSAHDTFGPGPEQSAPAASAPPPPTGPGDGAPRP